MPWRKSGVGVHPGRSDIEISHVDSDSGGLVFLCGELQDSCEEVTALTLTSQIRVHAQTDIESRQRVITARYLAIQTERTKSNQAIFLVVNPVKLVYRIQIDLQEVRQWDRGIDVIEVEREPVTPIRNSSYTGFIHPGKVEQLLYSPVICSNHSSDCMATWLE